MSRNDRKRGGVEEHLSLAEAAERLGISERTARRWIKSGKLRAYKPGRDYWIPESALTELVEESEVSPKEQAPPPEPSLFNGTLDERRFAEIGELLERRHARRLRQVEDPNDPHFRDAAAAANWIADVQEEADEVIRWIIEHGEALAGTWEDLGMMAGVALFAETPVWLGEQRLEALGEPDELTARRQKKTAANLEESRQQLETAVNG